MKQMVYVSYYQKCLNLIQVCLSRNLIKLAIIMIFVGVAEFVSCGFVVQKITTKTLAAERALFEKFTERYCGVCLEQPIAQKMVADAFDYEELCYKEALPGALFFNALHEDQVVGYISCDLLKGYHIRIRQLAIEPLMFDPILVKELFYAIFATVPKTKKVTVCCPIACVEFTTLFEELGFVRVLMEHQPIVDLYATYELKVHSKCKICDVLYGDIWDTEEDIDSDWADASESIGDESGWKHAALEICPMVEDEQDSVCSR